MIPDNIELSSALEAIQYDSIKPNIAYKNQSQLYLPKGGSDGINKYGVVYLLSPSREASMSTINGNYVTFYKSGFRIYTVATRYNEKIGSRRIHENKRTEIRREFMDNRSNSAMRFIAMEELSKLIDNSKNSFIYDMGSWNNTYFINRYVRNTKFLCQNYIEFIAKRMNEVPVGDYKHKIIYIPAHQWFKGNILGIRKKDLNNPLSIIMLSLYRFPEMLRPIVDGDYDIIIADEPGKVFIKVKIQSINAKDTKALYAKLKVQLRRMTCFTVEDEDEKEIEKEAMAIDERTELMSTMTKRLTGDPTAGSASSPAPTSSKHSEEEIQKAIQKAEKSKETNIFNMDDSYNEIEEEEEDTKSETSEEDNLFADETKDDSEINEEMIDDEIENTVASAINDDDDLASGTYGKGAAEDIIEDKVKRDVFISKFVPERTAKQTAQIEEYAKRQEEVIKQTVPEMKSKLIDTSSYKEVLDVHNENIKESKFANFDKSYVEKKLKPDLVGCVSKLSTADYPLFIENIEVEDTSDVMTQKDTYTYHLVDENGKKFKIVLDIPKIIDNNYVYIAGNKRLLLKQRLNRPIVKISPNTVQISTWYNKCMITRHGDAVDSKTTAISKHLSAQSNMKKYHVIFGNAKVRNKNYRTSLDFDVYAKNIIEATIGDTRFIFDLQKLEEEMKKAGIKEKLVVNDMLACGITKDGTIVRCAIDGKMSAEESGINNILMSKMTSDAKSKINSHKAGKSLAYARMTILAQHPPVIFFMLFCEGFTKTMSDCGIKYEVYDNTKENRNASWGSDKDIVETMDKIIVYDKYPYENSLLMNGLKGLPLHTYTFEELDSKDTYIDMVPIWYSSANMTYSLNQFKDFLLDDAAIEMLRDFNQPTELVPLLFYAVQLLVNNQYVGDTDMSSMRIRSTEVIPNIAYDIIVDKYGAYRTSKGRSNKGTLNVPRDSVIKALQASTVLDDASVSNPIMTVEKIHTCTIKASSDAMHVNLGGQNKSNGMTHARRAYDPTMVGTFGITSTPDAEVGIKRFLTVEPNITSTRGYIETTDPKDVDKLNSANLFTFAESLTPPGVRHDDPPRTGMMYSQSSHMVQVEDSSPVLIGNHVESVVPYHMSGEFCFVAKKSGSIVDCKKGIYIVKYDDGTFDSFDTNPVIHKNAAEGMYTEVQFTCDHPVGYKFKKNEVLAMEKRAFSRDENGRTASMNIGVLAKVAIASCYDIYEDSEPVTKKLSERLATTVIHMKPVTLNAATYVDKIVKIGDKVSVGDPLVKFDANSGDPEIEEFLAALKDRTDLRDKLVESTQTVVKADESGEIADVRVYTTVPVESLSPSLQKIVKDYHERVSVKSNVLDKYKNSTDNEFYKCGQLLRETTDVTEAKFGKIKGQQVDDGVYIEIYTKFKDNIKKGDKQTNYCALKGVTSHVIPEGQEPFSEFRPDEEISALVAPLGILSRKTPSIFTNLFGNKVLIELKRKLKADYFSE